MSKFGSLSRTHNDDTSPPSDGEDCVAYDAETSDADTRHGQILQFACIRANAGLQTLEETSFRIRRLPYIVPSPEAIAVTGFELADLDNPAHPEEFQCAGRIEKLLRAPFNGVRKYITWNGLKFDDEIVRTTLFRNLCDPYVTSGRGATRIDGMLLTQLACTGDATVLEVPLNEEGKRSWRLEKIAEANGVTIVAHDALGDARATLEIASRVRQRAPWAWDIAVRGGNAAAAGSMLETARRDGRPVYHFEHFGQPDLAPCVVLGTDGKGKWLLFDLRMELDDIHLADGWDIDDIEWRKSVGLRVVRASTMPLFVPAAETGRFGPTLSETGAEKLSQQALSHKSKVETILTAFLGQSFEPRIDPTSEERIYEGWPTPADKSRRDAFRRAKEWKDRASIRFDDPRLNDFAARILAMTAPPADLFGHAPGSDAERFEKACAATMARPLATGDVRWQTIEKALPNADDAWIKWAGGVWGTDFINRAMPPRP